MKKNFEVHREKSHSEFGGYTYSKLFYEGQPYLINGRQVVGLEDEERAVKVHGETRIPAGKYRLTVTFSPKFKRDLIEVLGVPNFTSIRWHSGNTEDQTDGCLLVGNQIGQLKGKPAVFGGQAGKVEENLTNFVKDLLKQGFEVYVTYKD